MHGIATYWTPRSKAERLSRITPQYTYSPATGRYRNRVTGRFVPFAEVRSALNQMVDGARERMGNLTQGLIEGRVSPQSWAKQMMQEIKLSHLAAAAAAKGGWHQMTAADYGRVGAEVKKQYRFFRNWMQELEQGKAPLDGRAVVRAGLYAQSAARFYEAEHRRAKIGIGYTQERRIRHASESCNDCVAYEAMGWQPIGTLPPIGQSECNGNCKCTFDYR